MSTWKFGGRSMTDFEDIVGASGAPRPLRSQGAIRSPVWIGLNATYKKDNVTFSVSQSFRIVHVREIILSC